jgi:hypothetical protein
VKSLQTTDAKSGVEKKFGHSQAQGFLNFFNPSPVSDLPSSNLQDKI